MREHGKEAAILNRVPFVHAVKISFLGGRFCDSKITS